MASHLECLLEICSLMSSSFTLGIFREIVGILVSISSSLSLPGAVSEARQELRGRRLEAALTLKTGSLIEYYRIVPAVPLSVSLSVIDSLERLNPGEG